jgi:hypothetical protein
MENMNLYDAIIIPGGGVKTNYELPLWTRRRLDKTIEKKQHSRYIITLSAGTTHKPPPVDNNGFPIYESIAAAHYLANKGVASDKLLYECVSYDTIGNAYFAKIIHIDPLALSKLLIITSDFHMERTKAIFEWMFSPPFSNNKYHLEFESVSDEGIDKKMISERKKREKESLNNFIENIQKIKNSLEFHKWLFSEHRAYTISKDNEILNNDVLKTY